jgi:hypothetical protein
MPRKPSTPVKTPPASADKHPPAPITEQIAPPGKLDGEGRDAAITGGTRSLKRRAMGLDVLTARAEKRPRPRNAAKQAALKPAPLQNE